MLTHYYNEFSAYPARWLRSLAGAGLIPPGHVDERDIRSVLPADAAGYVQCHWFAGVGGWPLALRLAGWPDARPVWTASCPCQPFSGAGKKKGAADARHLWPDLFRILRECRPPVVFGEQVASPDGLPWLDGVFADLEGAGYACWAVDCCAAGVAAPHIRQRLYWVADAGRQQQQAGAGQGRGVDAAERGQPGVDVVAGRLAGGLAHAPDVRGPERLDHAGERQAGETAYAADGAGAGWLAVSHVPEFRGQPPAGELSLRQRGAGDGGMDDPAGQRAIDRRPEEPGGDGPDDRIPWPAGSPWSDFLVIGCRDNKARRVGAQCGDEPLAHGLPARVGPGVAGLVGLDDVAGRASLRRAKRNRVGRIAGYGNAVVPLLAAEFVANYMDAEGGAA